MAGSDLNRADSAFLMGKRPEPRSCPSRGAARPPYLDLGRAAGPRPGPHRQGRLSERQRFVNSSTVSDTVDSFERVVDQIKC